jgi:uncharacterized protein
MIRAFLLAFLFLVAAPAAALDFPPLSGRVVDQAALLDPAQEAALTQKLAALEQASSRQLVIVTVPTIGDATIEDYGYQLGRHWGIGQSAANNGTLLIVAVNERKVRIEVGYGLEGILTDALSSQIIRNDILPRFRAGDFPGGIEAGTDAIIRQLQAPPEAAEQAALAAQQAEGRRASGQAHRGGVPGVLIFWLVMLFVFMVIPAIASAAGGRRYRRGVSIWGPGTPYRHRDNGGLGWLLTGIALDSIARRGGGGWGGGSSWDGGGGFGGGGGFSGGGGSFGGGGASGGW